MVWTSLLTVVLAQSPAIQDGVVAQMAFHRGTQFRKDGKIADSAAAFRSAAHALESDSLPPSPAVSFKAGNAWFLAGDLPNAIAAYRRGLALDPANTDLRTAIEFAREQVQFPPAPELARLLPPEPQYWPAWLSLASTGGYAFAAYCAACLTATRWRMTRRRCWLVAAGLFFMAGIAPTIGTGMEWWQARCDAAEPIVVVNRDVPLRAGNGVDYPPRLDLPRGCEVRRLFERGSWLQVQTGGGIVGWAPADAMVHDR